MHVMFDLETFGTKPGSVLRSIGAATFDPKGTGGGETFYRNICRESCEAAGLTIDPSTERWWAEQSKEAQDALLTDVVPLADVAKDFYCWFIANRGEQIWCQGANFDSVLWEAAVTAIGQRVPWKFWNVRDTRTVYDIAGFNPKSLPREGTYHNALDDSLYQVKCVQGAIEKMGVDALL